MTKKNPFRLKQVSVRLKTERPLYSNQPIRSPIDAARLVKDLITEFDREVVCIINLRADLCPINFAICSIGTLQSAIAEPRDLIKAACLSNASQFMMIHNHPGGSLSPSKADVEVTDRMIRLGVLLDIPMCDHLIVASGTDEYFSFHEHDLLKFEKPQLETDPENIQFAPSFAAEPMRILQEDVVEETSAEELQNTLLLS